MTVNPRICLPFRMDAASFRQSVKGLSALVAQSPASEELVTADGMAGEGREQLDGLGDPQPAWQRGVLQLCADALAQLRSLGYRVQPEHPDPSAIGAAKPLDTLDGRCLAGAVGAEDAKDLSCLDVERQVVHGHDTTVGLTQVIHGDHAHTTRLYAPVRR